MWTIKKSRKSKKRGSAVIWFGESEGLPPTLPLVGVSHRHLTTGLSVSVHFSDRLQAPQGHQAHLSHLEPLWKGTVSSSQEAGDTCTLRSSVTFLSVEGAGALWEGAMAHLWDILYTTQHVIKHQSAIQTDVRYTDKSSGSGLKTSGRRKKTELALKDAFAFDLWKGIWERSQRKGTYGAYSG